MATTSQNCNSEGKEGYESKSSDCIKHSISLSNDYNYSQPTITKEGFVLMHIEEEKWSTRYVQLKANQQIDCYYDESLVSQTLQIYMNHSSLNVVKKCIVLLDCTYYGICVADREKERCFCVKTELERDDWFYQIRETLNPEQFAQKNNQSEMEGKDNQPQKHVGQCTEVSKCSHWIQLQQIIKRYNAFNNSNKSHFHGDDIDILVIINNYLHLMGAHKSDKEFEFITNCLGSCEIKKCECFARNNTRRLSCYVKKDIPQNNSTEDMVCTQVMDKIHCYFQHTYDTGKKLTIVEKQLIHNAINLNCSKDSENIVNKIMLETNKILAPKRHSNKVSEAMKQKFNQLQNEEHKNQGDDPVYSFGYSFDYGYNNEWRWASRPVRETAINVSQKHLSLKEELTTNLISIISIENFNIEYQKAKIYYSSAYCRTNTNKHKFKLEMLLCLMIYCNFTELQYQFSKTYREGDGKLHTNFYCMGKNLKQCLHFCGTVIGTAGTDIDAFYHGISEQLLFPKYFDLTGNKFNSVGTTGIMIFSPLSTSSSFEVAASFAYFNNGLIIEFVGERLENKPKYFSCDWLSDYPNEKEYLFIQNDYTLQVNNITDAQSGHQYETILNALKAVDVATSTNSASRAEPDHILDNLQKLISAIIYHKLSSVTEFPEFKSFDEYAIKMINRYCVDKTLFIMHYKKFELRYSFLKNVFFHTDFKWIRMDHITLLFPNIEEICVSYANVKTSIKIIHDIIRFFQNRHDQLKLHRICIKDIAPNSNLLAASAVKRLRQQFEKVNCKLKVYKKKQTKKIVFTLTIAPKNAKFSVHIEGDEFSATMETANKSAKQQILKQKDDESKLLATTAFNEYVTEYGYIPKLAKHLKEYCKKKGFGVSYKDCQLILQKKIADHKDSSKREQKEQYRLSCNKTLIKMKNSSSVYANGEVICDNYKHQCEANIMVWHCDKSKNQLKQNHIESVRLLNVDKNKSKGSLQSLMFSQRKNHKLYTVSINDKDMIFFIKFTVPVNLHCIELCALTDSIDEIQSNNCDYMFCGPTQINLYKVNTIQMEYDVVKSLEPDYIYEMTSMAACIYNISEKQKTFSSVKDLAIHFVTKKGEVVYLNTLKIEVDPKPKNTK
eukprot:397023_1